MFVFDTPEPSRTLRTLFGALVFVLGAQSLRFLFGSVTWYLRDTVGVATLDLIPIALAPFLLAAVLPIAARWLTVRGTMWIGVWLLVLARGTNQLTDGPTIDLWSSGVGTMAFVGLLPLMLSMGRSALVGGLLLGLALDSAIKGMGLSLDLAYQSGPAPLIGVLALGVAALYLLWASPPFERQGVSPASGAMLIGIGPWLFFQMLVLQNQGWTSEVARMSGPQTQLRIALLNVVTLVAVAWIGRNRLVSLLAGVALAATLLLAEGQPLVFNLLALIAIPAAGLVWSSLVPDPEARGLGPSGVYLTAGMTLFVILGLAYYVPMDIDVGVTQQQVRLGVVILLGLFVLAGLLTLPATRPGVPRQAWAFAALASVLPLLGFFLTAGSAEETNPEDRPVRVMTYNIHSAYDVSGRFDIEAIARVIEDSDASIVGLQEVPRGRLISGVTDELTLLAQRLGFVHIAFFGTTDPTWGNAVLSRFPIIEVEKTYLPRAGTPLRRGYLGTTLALGDETLLFISTHLQHINDSSVHDEDPEADLYPVHHQQIETILSSWGGVEPAVMVGDFNARPGWEQVAELLDGGWVDSWAEVGQGDGFTSNAVDPQHRIDYIFHTPDVEAVDIGVIQSQASDHFAVAADLNP